MAMTSQERSAFSLAEEIFGALQSLLLVLPCTCFRSKEFFLEEYFFLQDLVVDLFDLFLWFLYGCASFVDSTLMVLVWHTAEPESA
jgi:hypothetical protein